MGRRFWAQSGQYEVLIECGGRGQGDRAWLDLRIQFLASGELRHGLLGGSILVTVSRNWDIVSFLLSGARGAEAEEEFKYSRRGLAG